MIEIDTVVLSGIKDAKRKIRLPYEVQEVALVQRRVAGRFYLKPKLNLNNYRCRAVIDWIEIEVELRRSTQFRFVKSALNSRSADDRGRMVGVLARHIFPGRDFLTNRWDRPRFAWGRDARLTRRLLRSSVTPSIDNLLLTSSEGDKSAPVDATFYVGRRSGPASWRVMEKILDVQNPNTGTSEELPEEKKRARLEVTLGIAELRRLKLERLSDLNKFQFSRLQGDYFRFMLPTFSLHDLSGGSPVAVNREKERQKRFMNVGVVGLLAMDSGRIQFRKQSRHALVQHLHARGKRVRADRRVGIGPAGTFIAYQELNARVMMALRKLSEREGRKSWM